MRSRQAVSVGSRYVSGQRRQETCQQFDSAAEEHAQTTDKTSGRKRPRLDDVDVVPAGDADDDEAAAIHAAIVPPVDNVQTSATVSASSSSIAPCGVIVLQQ